MESHHAHYFDHPADLLLLAPPVAEPHAADATRHLRTTYRTQQSWRGGVDLEDSIRPSDILERYSTIVAKNSTGGEEILGSLGQKLTSVHDSDSVHQSNDTPIFSIQSKTNGDGDDFDKDLTLRSLLQNHEGAIHRTTTCIPTRHICPR